MPTRRQLMGLAGATIDANGNLIAYPGPMQDLFVNPAAGDFRIKDASIPAGIGAFGSASGTVTSTPTQTSPPITSSSGPSIGIIAAIAIGAFLLMGD